jgi:Na+-driven multidrug efflux pump
MPINMLNSFSTAALRSSGDSVRPMIYSIVSGAVNVVANFLFVAAFKMTVSGVALATVLASALSLVLALIRLFRGNSLCRAEFKYMRVNEVEFVEIVRVGLPTCFCSIFFYIANVVLSSAVNSMSVEAMTANSISGQFDGMIYTIGSAIASATSVMVAQNYGARQFDRIRKVMRVGIIYSTAVSLILGAAFVIFAEPLLGILEDDPAVIAIAKERMTFLCLTYFLTTIMEVMAFSLRSLKHQKSTMVVGAVCGVMRCVWAWFIWPMFNTLWVLFTIYSTSAAVAIIIYLFVYKGVLKEFKAEKEKDLILRTE